MAASPRTLAYDVRASASRMSARRRSESSPPMRMRRNVLLASAFVVVVAAVVVVVVAAVGGTERRESYRRKRARPRLCQLPMGQRNTAAISTKSSMGRACHCCTAWGRPPVRAQKRSRLAEKMAERRKATW